MKRGIRNLLILLCLIIAGICIGFIVLTLMRRQQNGQIYNTIQETVRTTETAGETETEDGVIPAESAVKSDGTVIDFDALKELNSDIYAWIEIPGTAVDYPIVQSPTDDRY